MAATGIISLFAGAAINIDELNIVNKKIMEGFMSYAVGSNLSILNVPFLSIVSVSNIPENSHLLDKSNKNRSNIRSISYCIDIILTASQALRLQSL